MGNTYEYKIEVSGLDRESQVTYIVLTNNTKTSFEDVRYSLINISKYRVIVIQSPCILYISFHHFDERFRN